METIALPSPAAQSEWVTVMMTMTKMTTVKLMMMKVTTIPAAMWDRHFRLGHVALPRIQKLMRTGALGHHPNINIIFRPPQ